LADLRNVPADGGQGGAITAALFLKEFVEGRKLDGGEIEELRFALEERVETMVAAGAVSKEEGARLRARGEEDCQATFGVLRKFREGSEGGEGGGGGGEEEKLAAALTKLAKRNASGCDCESGEGAGLKWVHFDIDTLPGGKPEAQGMRAMYEVIREIAEEGKAV